MTILERRRALRPMACAAAIAALLAAGGEGWLGPADDEGRPTVGEMGEDHQETGTPGVPEELEEEEAV